ncbi:thioredoxin family protein [Maribacter sp. 2210JD10-5]|uniref:thioredoxin family protein n=1 Tax=Maribacter sp. 2210JD10-5 TaxID=3386272 RepID=UPI0039BCE8EF
MKAQFSILFFLISIFVFSQEWEETYEAAEEKLEGSGKNLLLVFSGSDWCAPCIRMERQFFETADFEDYANENLILYKADFPRKKKNQLAPDLVETNKKLSEKFNPKSYVPLVVLLNKKQEVLGEFGYRNKPPAYFISLLNSFQK